MKNTFCLTRDGYAFMSHHIGEMGNYVTLQSFEQGIAHFERLFRAAPTLIVDDLHPDYLATRYAVARAESERLPRVSVQHHHAHIAACMVENGLDGARPVIGVCFDGTGYGTDGTIWGGEFLVADYHMFTRAAHFKAMPLPGGDAATRKPARIAYAYLLAADLDADDETLPHTQALSVVERGVIRQQIAQGINTPLTSSAGRVFDAVSALLGVCQATTYEGQAAIEFEALADATADGVYPLDADAHGVIDPAPLLAACLADLRAGVPVSVIAGRVHHSMAVMIARVCQRIAQDTGLREVALTGGVFQNVTLLAKTVPLLEAAGLRVYTHRQVPPNDGGLALGQAVIGAVQWMKTNKG
jgi:hydrogenase maturation protein HypF